MTVFGVLAHDAIPANRIEDYKARAALLSKEVLKEWNKGLPKFDRERMSLTVLGLSAVMEEGFWDGRTWKNGYPRLATERIAMGHEHRQQFDLTRVIEQGNQVLEG